MQHNTPLQSVKTIWRSLWDKKYTLLDLTNCRTPCAKNKSLNDEPLTSRSSVAWNNYPCKAVEFISQSPIQPNSVNIGIRAKPESGRKIMINLAVLSRSTYFDRTHYTWGSSGLLFFLWFKAVCCRFCTVQWDYVHYPRHTAVTIPGKSTPLFTQIHSIAPLL